MTRPGVSQRILLKIITRNVHVFTHFYKKYFKSLSNLSTTSPKINIIYAYRNLFTGFWWNSPRISTIIILSSPPKNISKISPNILSRYTPKTPSWKYFFQGFCYYFFQELFHFFQDQLPRFFLRVLFLQKSFLGLPWVFSQ